MSVQGVIDHGIEGFEIAMPVAPALELVPPNPDTKDTLYFTVVYGAGTFVVGATSPEAAAEIGRLERMEICDENALPLAMRVSEQQVETMARVHNNKIPQLTTVANPLHSTPRVRQPSTVRPPSNPKEEQLFSWITHGGTGEVIYRYPHSSQE